MQNENVSTGNESIYRENVKQYFNGDQLAADVWWQKYRAENEIHPIQMVNRLTDEITKYGQKWLSGCSRIEKDLSEYGKELFLKYFDTNIKEKYLRDVVFKNLDGFKRIVLGGSMNSGIGANDYSSLSNCLVLGAPEDSYAGILWKDHELVECMKRRCGVGIALDNIRPSGARVNNQSKISSGVAQFMKRFSNTTRECSQNGRRKSVLRVC